MASYISSNQNRFYTSVEAAYGVAQTVGPSNRYPALHFKASQAVDSPKRLDKTGSRTYQALASTGRVRTAFEVRSYLSAWNGATEPAYGPLFQAACGAPPCFNTGSMVNSLVNPTEMVTSTPHGLSVGRAISWSNEIRFVTGILNAYTFTFNAPFSNSPLPGNLLGPTVTYPLASDLPSVTVYDYWDSQTMISRLVSGCAVNSLELVVNGDYHDFTFSGPGSTLVDVISFSAGQGGLSQFPPEPLPGDFNGMAVPGHLGQVWIGVSASQFFTLTEAKVSLKNNIDLRRNEFGITRPAAIVPGERSVATTFSLLVQNDNQTLALYQAAKQRQPFPAMLQLGTQQGQIMGVYLPQVVAELPDYNDTGTRLTWDFKNSIAQGVTDDELFIAFA